MAGLLTTVHFIRRVLAIVTIVTPEVHADALAVVTQEVSGGVTH